MLIDGMDLYGYVTINTWITLMNNEIHMGNCQIIVGNLLREYGIAIVITTIMKP